MSSVKNKEVTLRKTIVMDRDRNKNEGKKYYFFSSDGKYLKYIASVSQVLI